MIHLKRFDEAVSDWDLNLIRKFCYENLAYLLDEGANLDFKYFECYDYFSNPKCPNYRVIIKNINSKWSDIEADICPFLELLEEKYDLLNISTNNQIEIMSAQYTGNIWFSINEIIAGCIDGDTEISGIRFLIKL
jgi:hypothetical protein